MLVCPDCSAVMADPQSACRDCDWTPRRRGAAIDYLATGDRESAATDNLIETYEALGERDWSGAVEDDPYLDRLGEGFADVLGDLAGRSVCDVGPGRGFFIKHVLARGGRITAVDIAAASLQQIAERYRVPCYIANAENLPFRGEFDILAALGILTIVPNVGNFLVSANWALRPGGILAVQVANREKLLPYSRFFGLPVPFTKLRSFDRRLIVDLVSEAGFKVERVVMDGYMPDYAAAWLERYPALRKRLRDRLVARYGLYDASRLPLRRLLLKPLLINVIARKVEEIAPRRLYDSYAAVVEARRRRRRADAEVIGTATETSIKA